MHPPSAAAPVIEATKQFLSRRATGMAASVPGGNEGSSASSWVSNTQPSQVPSDAALDNAGVPTIWSVRPVRVEDAAVIARHRYFDAGAKDDLAAYERWVATRIERGTYNGVLAEADGVVIAGAGAVLLDWGPTRGEPTGLRGRLVNVYTDPAWRRQGVARGLVQEVMRRCQKRDVQVFNLAATDDSAALYRSIGFVPYTTEMILRP